MHSKTTHQNKPLYSIKKNEAKRSVDKLFNNISQKEAFRKTFTITSTLN